MIMVYTVVVVVVVYRSYFTSLLFVCGSTFVCISSLLFVVDYL